MDHGGSPLLLAEKRCHEVARGENHPADAKQSVPDAEAIAAADRTKRKPVHAERKEAEPEKHVLCR